VRRSPRHPVIVFHSWDEAFVLRGMNVLPLTWTDGVPSL